MTPIGRMTAAVVAMLCCWSPDGKATEDSSYLAAVATARLLAALDVCPDIGITDRDLQHHREKIAVTGAITHREIFDAVSRVETERFKQMKETDDRAAIAELCRTVRRYVNETLR
jgi:hypothetical protein